MRITISGRNIELTEGLKQAVEEKLSKLEKFFKPDTDVYVTLSVEKDRQKIEVTIPAKGHVIRSEQVSNDMYVSIDLVEEVIERQLRKYRIGDFHYRAYKIISENLEEYYIDEDDLSKGIKKGINLPLELDFNLFASSALIITPLASI